MQTFSDYVTAFEDLSNEVERMKKELKRKTDAQMVMRRELTRTIKDAMGDAFKEGVNKFSLADGRVVKVDYKIDRKIEESMVLTARQEYARLNDTPCDFDDLIRVKYELNIAPFRKLENAALLAISQMVVAKEAAPTVTVE